MKLRRLHVVILSIDFASFPRNNHNQAKKPYNVFFSLLIFAYLYYVMRDTSVSPFLFGIFSNYANDFLEAIDIDTLQFIFEFKVKRQCYILCTY